MTLVFYISGHGLGHVSRAIKLIEILGTRRPDLRVIVRTNAARWPFQRLQGRPIELQPCEADTGVAQIDSLRLDEDETARRAAVFHAAFDRRVADEAKTLRQVGADLVLGDIPPLAFAAAHEAGIRSIAIANFTWDWIYADYPRFEHLAPGVVADIRRAYACATLALRLPMHGGFESMAAVTRDIPFIARRSARDPADTRSRLGCDGDRLLALSSFAGHGLALPYDRLRDSGLTLLAPERGAPAGLVYEDLVAAADVVVSKPGYGIVSECIANRTPLVYTDRGRFREYDVMVEELPRVLRSRYLAQDELLAGNWAAAIQAVLEQPEPAEQPRIDGAEIAAQAILEVDY
jgi:L-arabinokinase